MHVGQFNHSQSFKGLWDNSEYIESKTLYGGEVDVDYYSKTYHPFADETNEMILKEMVKMDRILNQSQDPNSPSQRYTTLITGQRLAMKTDVYNDIIEGRMNKELPLLDTTV